jgi:hypothetical protein
MLVDDAVSCTCSHITCPGAGGVGVPEFFESVLLVGIALVGGGLIPHVLSHLLGEISTYIPMLFPSSVARQRSCFHMAGQKNKTLRRSGGEGLCALSCGFSCGVVTLTVGIVMHPARLALAFSGGSIPGCAALTRLAILGNLGTDHSLCD